MIIIIILYNIKENKYGNDNINESQSLSCENTNNHNNINNMNGLSLQWNNNKLDESENNIHSNYNYREYNEYIKNNNNSNSINTFRLRHYAMDNLISHFMYTNK